MTRATITQNNVQTPSPAHTLWIQQDQLLFHAMFASFSEHLLEKSPENPDFLGNQTLTLETQ